jgi:hypothetical protein
LRGIVFCVILLIEHFSITPRNEHSHRVKNPCVPDHHSCDEFKLLFFYCIRTGLKRLMDGCCAALTVPTHVWSWPYGFDLDGYVMLSCNWTNSFTWCVITMLTHNRLESNLWILRRIFHIFQCTDYTS